MSDSREVSARCLCGSWRLYFTIPESQLPLKGALCHCDSCRRNTGNLAIWAAPLPEAATKDANASLAHLQTYRWSPRKTVHFCSTCGTPTLEIFDNQLWIRTGCLDQLEGVVQFEYQIFVNDTRDGGLGDWINTHDGKPIKSYANNQDDPTEPIKLICESGHGPDRLHAHCRCGGVEFWVSRPSATSANTSSPWSDLLVPFHSGPSNHNPNEPWWLREDGTKFLSGCCACDSCRLASGCELQQWAFIPASDISLSQDGNIPFSREFGTLKSYRSSDEAVRYFCGHCSATIFWTGDVRPDLIDVAVGLLDAPEGSRASSLLDWCTTRISFREDAVPRAHKLIDHVEQTLQQWGQGGSSKSYV